MPNRDKPLLTESFINEILKEMGNPTTGPSANDELGLEERQINWLADFLIKKHGSRAEEMAQRYRDDLTRK